jgi:hypothetical protein
VTRERPTPEQVVEGYDVLFDPLMRAAHRAALEYATITRDDQWPTPSIVSAFAQLYAVSAAELGAFFGLLSYRDGDRTVWVDAVRGPVTAAMAAPYLSRGQSVAFGFMKCAVAPGKCQ